MSLDGEYVKLINSNVDMQNFTSGTMYTMRTVAGSFTFEYTTINPETEKVITATTKQSVTREELIAICADCVNLSTPQEVVDVFNAAFELKLKNTKNFPVE